MPAALPIIAAFSTVSAAGGVVAAMSTFAGFMTVAGGVLSGIGLLTGKEDLMKIGGLMSLGGAAAGALGGAGGAGGAAGAGEASAAEAFRASEIAATNEAALGTIGAANPNAVGGATMAPAGAPAGATAGLPEGAGLGDTFSHAPGTDLGQSSLMSKAMSQQSGAQPTATSIRPDAIADAGSKLTADELSAVLKTARSKGSSMLSGVGDFLRNNKELVQMGGSALQSAYGPQAEMVDWEKSILQRRLQNLNSPIRLGRPLMPNTGG